LGQFSGPFGHLVGWTLKKLKPPAVPPCFLGTARNLPKKALMSTVRRLAVVMPLGHARLHTSSRRDEESSVDATSNGKRDSRDEGLCAVEPLRTPRDVSHDETVMHASSDSVPRLQATFVAQVLGQLTGSDARHIPSPASVYTQNVPRSRFVNLIA
jgi:hypothetical protein